MGHTLQKGNYRPYMGNSGNDAGERMKIQECSGHRFWEGVCDSL